MRGKTIVGNQRFVTLRERGAIRTKRTVLAAIFSVGIASAQNSPQAPLSTSEKDSLTAPVAGSTESVRRPGASEAVLRNNEGVRLTNEGRYAEAEQSYRAALEIGCDDDLVRAKIATNLGTLYQREDRYPEAERMLRSALELRQKNLPVASADVAYSLNNLAEIYRIEGRDWEARKLMETAAQRLRESHSDDAGFPIILTNLAVVLCHFDQLDQAQELLRSAVVFYEKHGQTAGRGYGIALNNLGQISEIKNDLEAAGSLYQQAIGIFETLGDSGRTDLAATLARAGMFYQKMARTAEAQQAEQRALGLLHPEGDTLLRAQILWNLGNITAQGSKPSDALHYFEQSLIIHEDRLGAEHPATANLLMDYASATKRAGNKSLSRKLYKRAQDLLAKISTRSLGQMTVSLRDLRDSR